MNFMSVKIKALLISFISFLFITVFTFTIFNFIIFRYINGVEIEDLNNSFKAVNSILNKEEMDVKRICSDWAQWDDTYNFLLGKNKQRYIEDNLQNSTLKQLNLSFMFFVDKQGNIFYSETSNLENTTKNLLLDKLFNKSDKPNTAIILKNNDENHYGILMISGKLFVINSLPITTSDGKAKSNGSLIVGRYVDNSLLNYINSIVECKVGFIENTDPKKVNNIIKKNNDSITVYKQVGDINGNMSIAISISMMRNEYNIGKFYFKIFVSIFSAVLILMLLIFIGIFNKFLLKRLKSVNDFIDTISKTKNTKARLNISGNDEITNIANSTNKMLSELDRAHKEILTLSYSDKLTGLKNRAYMEKKFSALDAKTDSKYSIIMGDLNGLKLTNDTFGHKEGDRLICKIGNILRNVCSKDDIIARWGGDEFIILIINKETPLYK
jgi:sensor domain CHASE-containing protein